MSRPFSKDEQLGHDFERDAGAYTESERDRYGHAPKGWFQPGDAAFFCDECDSRPCADYCTTQQTPDTLAMKAARAGMRTERYATERADVLARYPDSPAAREAAALLSQDQGRRIYGPDALAVAMSVVAGERTVEQAMEVGRE